MQLLSVLVAVYFNYH